MNKFKARLKLLKNKWRELPKSLQSISIIGLLLLLIGAGLKIYTPDETREIEEVNEREEVQIENIAPKQIYVLKPVGEEPLTNPFEIVHTKADNKEKVSLQKQEGLTDKEAVNKNRVAKAVNKPIAKEIKMDLQLTGILMFQNKAIALVKINKETRRIKVGDNLPIGQVKAITKNSMSVATPLGIKLYNIN